MRGVAPEHPSQRRPSRGLPAALAGVPLSLRGAALTPAAALAVHQARYELAFGANASRALSEQGHAYLSSLVPWIVLLAGLSLGASVGRFAQRWAAGSGRAPQRVAFARTWLATALVLFAIFAGQELLEGAFATGHLGGLAAVFGAGGWWALPAALLAGGALALALRGARTVETALEALRPGVRLAVRAPAELVAQAGALSCALVAPLARAAAGRAPPRRLITPL